MPLSLTWQDIALRLALTLAAAALIGANRESRGQAAGLRTTMLVALAAAVAAIQMNLLLPVAGKTGSSFSVMDVMRLPLGILSGIGFIGAGAILRRGELVVGVTTAATLWMVTVIGLCFGGGQLGLGAAAAILAGLILWLLKELDRRITHVRHATLRLTAGEEADPAALLKDALPDLYHVSLVDMVREEGRQVAVYEVKWRHAENDAPPLEQIAQLRRQPGVTAVSWLTAGKRD